MKRVLILFPVLLFVLAACAPGTREVPAQDPVFYGGVQSDVFAATVQVISTSPGLDNSTGWIITQSDAAGGFVRAETVVTSCGFLGGCNDEQEFLTVVVSPASDTTSQVVIQGTRKALEQLAPRISGELRSEFGLSGRQG